MIDGFVNTYAWIYQLVLCIYFLFSTYHLLLLNVVGTDLRVDRR